MASQLLTQSANFYKQSCSKTAIKVEPSEVIRFESVHPGTLYVKSFVLRNSTETAQRIRIQPPKRSFFNLKYLPGTAIAPGLEVHAEIECQIPPDTVDFIFTETIIATMGFHEVEIPIYATKICAKFEFDNYVNLGCATNGDKELSKEIIFENKGKWMMRIKTIAVFRN
jgi:hypothetical protein